MLICGDTHGDTEWVRALIGLAETSSCERVLICGDFGYWVHRGDGRQYLSEVDNAVRASRIVEGIDFVDGNHEHHSSHPAKPPHRRTGLQELTLATHPDGIRFAQVAEHVRYAGRGARWQWGNTRFGALGGAASTDRETRKRYRDWWVEETPTAADVARLGTEPLDVLICHDAPGDHLIDPREDRTGDRRSKRVRELLTEAVANTSPQLVFHGHWHLRYDTTVNIADRDVTVVGLGANVDPDGEEGVEPTDAAVVFDTHTRAVSAPTT